jgi:RNA polymerase sigma factor (sigma-70 family)
MATTPDELIPTRATLIQRLKDWQDQSSWQDFFDTYWNLIYGVAVKGGLTPAEAEDVVQETMVSVAKHMPGFQYDPKIGSFKAWLLNMTRWRITDQLRRRGPQMDSSEREDENSFGHGKMHEEPDQVAPELEKIWDAEWEKNLLAVAMSRVKRRLDPKQYQIFDCYVNKNLTPEKVAKAFDIPVGQVYLAKHRVTELIRDEIERLRNGMI